MDTTYGRRGICRIGNWLNAFSCEELALIHRISFPGYGVLEAYTSQFSGAVSMCNPFDLVKSDEFISQGFNKIYNRSLGKALSGILNKHLLVFEDLRGDYNIELAANAQNIREYDEGLTRVSFSLV
ncbi:hypothetical protein Tco_0815659, partial [Tanacetum coccineum]